MLSTQWVYEIARLTEQHNGPFAPRVDDGDIVGVANLQIATLELRLKLIIQLISNRNSIKELI